MHTHIWSAGVAAAVASDEASEAEGPSEDDVESRPAAGQPNSVVAAGVPVVAASAVLDARGGASSEEVHGAVRGSA